MPENNKYCALCQQPIPTGKEIKIVDSLTSGYNYYNFSNRRIWDGGGYYSYPYAVYYLCPPLSALLSFLSAFTKEEKKKSNNAHYYHNYICLAFCFAITISYFIFGGVILQLILLSVLKIVLNLGK